MSALREAPNRDWISIHDVARSMGRELDSLQNWAVGSSVADEWNDVMRARPVKDLRTKKAGTGSHCLALYPPTWLPIIRAAIEEVRAKRAAQLELDL